MEYTNIEYPNFAIRQANDIIDEGVDPDLTQFCTNSKNRRKNRRRT